MKFSKSHREMGPQVEYTPPCNYYEPRQSHGSILTGSLVGPSLPKEHALFGLEKRFKPYSNPAPGPGTYYHPNQTAATSALVEQRSKIRQTRRQAFIGNESKSPSIPYNQSNLDEEEQEYVHELLMAEDLNKSALAIKPKSEGFTFSKSPRTIARKNDQKEKLGEQIPLQSINEYTQQKEKQRSRNQMKEQVKRANQRRQEIMNFINPEFVPSLQLIEIITRRRTKYNPGPGAYNSQVDYPRQVEPGVAFTTTKRFSEDNQSDLGPGQYRLIQQKQKSASFSKSARNLFNLKNQTDLEHRFYIDPLKGLRESNSTTKLNSIPFGSKIIRFQKIEKEQTHPEQSFKAKKQSKLQQVVEKRLKKLQSYQKKHTCESEGLLGISTMASTIQ